MTSDKGTAAIVLMFSAVEETVQRLLQNSSWESGHLCAIHLGAAERPHLPTAESFCDAVLPSAACIVALGPQIQPSGELLHELDATHLSQSIIPLVTHPKPGCFCIAGLVVSLPRNHTLT